MTIVKLRRQANHTKTKGMEKTMTVAFIEENVFYQHIKDKIAKLEQENVFIPMVTVSIEPGSGGRDVDRGIADPHHYDLVINTGNISIEKAVNTVSVLWMQKYAA